MEAQLSSNKRFGAPMPVTARRGFSLMQLLIVLLILGILSSVVVLAVGSSLERAADVGAESERETVQKAMWAYMLKHDLAVVPTPASCVTDLGSSDPPLYPGFLAKAQPGGGRGYTWDAEGNVYACSGSSAAGPVWADLKLVARVDLPGSGQSGQGYRVAAMGGSALVARRGGALARVDLSDRDEPELLGEASLSLGQRPAMTVRGSTAFFASRNNASELILADVGEPEAMESIGSLNLSGNPNANDVALQGTVAGIVRQSNNRHPEFCLADVSDPSAPTLLGATDLAGRGLGVALDGSYAYVASSSNNAELQIVDCTDPSAPQVVAQFNTPGSADGSAIHKSGATVLLVCGSDLLKLDVSIPTAPVLLGSYNAGDTIRDLDAAAGLAFLAVSRRSATGQVQVIDYSDDDPALVSAVALQDDLSRANANGIAYSEALGALLVALDAGSAELVVVAP